MSNNQFAKDVAKQLDRRRMRRKLVLLGLFGAVIALAITYLTCGHGWGVGGAGKGEGSGPGPGSGARTDAGHKRCSIRITADGIAVDGARATPAAAVATCKATTGADVVVTGDARQGDWDALRAKLEAAKVPIYTKH